MISLVSTVFNDRAGMERFFSAISLQTRAPDEVVIVDAGSRDGTWELLLAESGRTDRPWKTRAMQELGCNVARGRNLAIEAAQGGIIVSTDIGCDWDPDWLAELAEPLETDPGLELAIGSWAVKEGDLEGPWALTEWALKGDQRLEATAESYSSSRSIAYRKNTWRALGRYPEDLTLAGDDAVFHYLIEKASVNRTGASKVRCYWHRHKSLSGFFKESWRYGLGDGEAFIRGKDVLLIGGRLAMEATGLMLGMALLCAGPPGWPWIGLIPACVSLASIFLKLLNMRPAAGRLRRAGISRPRWRLVAFTYGTKWHWIRGYLRGLFRGKARCRGCRRSLKGMTPEAYRTRLRESHHHFPFVSPP